MTKIRESQGGAYESRGKFYARVTVAPQDRRSALLPWCASLDAAQARANVVQAWVNRLRLAGQTDFIEKIVELGAKADEETLAVLAGKVDAIAGNNFDRVEPAKGKGGPVTFRTFAESWTSGDLHRRHPDHIDEKASVQDDIERLEKHVYPHVEDVRVAAFTRAHADTVMSGLSPSLKKATRWQVAQVMNRVLNLAEFVGLIERSPLPRGWLPKKPRSDSIAKEALLPSEETRLLAGVDAQGKAVVPLAYRVAYAFMHREGMRKGEARRLTWADLNLGKGMVSLDENKTDRPRSWVLRPSMVRVLEHWKKLSAKTKAADPVFTDIQWEQLAAVYREHCGAVGIDRARLYQRKANKLQLRAHDMRAFFVTAGMFEGHDALWITDRTGHTSLGMLRTYERDVRRWRELGEAPIDAELAIPEFAAANTAANAAADPKPRSSESPTSARNHSLLGDKDSNLDKRSQNPLSCRWTIPQVAERRSKIYISPPRDECRTGSANTIRARFLVKRVRSRSFALLAPLTWAHKGLASARLALAPCECQFAATPARSRAAAQWEVYVHEDSTACRPPRSEAH
jgi:integrase